jgi:uncharacterized membrane protein required for colicin V production
MMQIPFIWFDGVVAALLVAGIFFGRKRGMSQELIPLIEWLCIVFGCAYGTAYAAPILAERGGISLFQANLTTYISSMICLLLIFSKIKRVLGEKLLGSDSFGRFEFYLGMAAGAIRFGCMVIAALSLLHAREFSEKELTAQRKFQTEVYGSTFFPSLTSVQNDIFNRSFSGMNLKRFAPFLLLNSRWQATTKPAPRPKQKEWKAEDVIKRQK